MSVQKELDMFSFILSPPGGGTHLGIASLKLQSIHAFVSFCRPDRELELGFEYVGHDSQPGETHGKWMT